VRKYRNIIWDLDDTLLPCGIHYSECKAIFGLYQNERTGVPATACEELVNAIDLVSVKLPNAFSKERYPTSFLAASMALDVITGKELDQNAASESYVIGQSVFEADYHVEDAVYEMLLRYKLAGFGLFLFTKGDFDVQTRKITKNALERVFRPENIQIVAQKNGELLKEVMLKHNLFLEDTILIGDSLKDDIGSAEAVGIDSILIDKEHTWGYDHADHTPTHTVDNVLDVPKLIPYE
jgi:putative hydrolase of the HAD superfamily